MIAKLVSQAIPLTANALFLETMVKGGLFAAPALASGEQFKGERTIDLSLIQPLIDAVGSRPDLDGVHFAAGDEVDHAADRFGSMFAASSSKEVQPLDTNSAQRVCEMRLRCFHALTVLMGTASSEATISSPPALSMIST